MYVHFCSLRKKNGLINIIGGQKSIYDCNSFIHIFTHKKSLLTTSRDAVTFALTAKSCSRRLLAMAASRCRKPVVSFRLQQNKGLAN